MPGKTNAFDLCVNSQTPLVRFRLSEEEIRRKYGLASPTLELSRLKEGEDYEYTAGGVTRMILPMLKLLLNKNAIKGACWISLNPAAPSKVSLDNIILNHVSLTHEELKGYGKAKEVIWNIIHGIESPSANPNELMKTLEFSDYLTYNKKCAEAMKEMESIYDFGMFYVHDFQQLAVGEFLKERKPKLFRWHIPFVEGLEEKWGAFLLSYFKTYDAIIMSCKRYVNALRRFGYDGKVYQLYPYVDEGSYKKPSKSRIQALRERLGLREDDKVLLVVARMDPMKGQDKAITALSIIRREIPNVKLVLVGNGSFTSAKEGLSMDKASRWTRKLLELCRQLRVEDSVVFAGYLSHQELESAYSLCDVTMLPSVLEGFGMVVIESWLYKKPVVVSSGAGISEIITDGENGLLFDPNNVQELAEKLKIVLSDEFLAQKLAEDGYETSKLCHLEAGASREYEVMQELMST